MLLNIEHNTYAIGDKREERVVVAIVPKNVSNVWQLQSFATHRWGGCDTKRAERTISCVVAITGGVRSTLVWASTQRVISG